MCCGTVVHPNMMCVHVAINFSWQPTAYTQCNCGTVPTICVVVSCSEKIQHSHIIHSDICDYRTHSLLTLPQAQ